MNSRLLKTEPSVNLLNEYIEDETIEEVDNLGTEELIMDSMMLSVRNVGGDSCDLGITKDYIINVLRSNICLICIDPVRKTDPAWNCVSCYTMIHLQCIQMWIREGVHQKLTPLSPHLFPNKEKFWHCPKCRREYVDSNIPKKYLCFCGQVEDPSFDAWLIPHSCGNVCSKRLVTDCGHKCLLLCHPGPCSPCPQTVSLSCHCGKSGLHLKRCGQARWSCGKPCNKSLACNLHKCVSICHPGECPGCSFVKKVKCVCGRNVKNISCCENTWSCSEVCSKTLSCGHHKCEKICHFGECGTCLLSGGRTCPCGKTKFDLPCTSEVPTCPESCGKLLLCGQHECTLKCHTGPCGTCREMSMKKCRCGKHRKELQCFKEYYCETKCMKMKSCGVHQCKRKCCDGDCPECNVVCSKTLSCRNHKCPAECHEGRCFPCVLSIELSCNCKLTKISIPCGAERFTKNPRCNHPCGAAPICHHPSTEAHVCHFGACPPCKQICDKLFKNCSHRCKLTCHTAVKTKMKNWEVRAGPWDMKNVDRYETLKVDCPPCDVMVNVHCLGRHESIGMMCSESGVRSCGRKCGRLLDCQQHQCQLDCHTIDGVSLNDSINAGKTCEQCDSMCEKERPDGCTHPCLLMCHKGKCPPCKQMLRMRCHCEMVVCHVECWDWLRGNDEDLIRLQSCGAQCPKMLLCGHQCKSKCHPGECPDDEPCREKVRLRCQCRRKKTDFKCYEISEGKGVACDDVCTSNKEKENMLKEEREKEEKAKIEEMKRQEMDKFDRLMSGGRKKKRRTVNEDQQIQPSFIRDKIHYLVGAVAVIFLSTFIYYLVNK